MEHLEDKNVPSTPPLSPSSHPRGTDEALMSLRYKFKSILCSRSPTVSPVDNLVPFNAPQDILNSIDIPALTHCYSIDINPTINYQITGLTSVVDDTGLRYQFNGVLLLSSVSLNHVPSFFVKQYNVDYVISLKPHPLPTESLVIQDVLLFMEYLFVNLLNLFDWFNDLLSKDYTILFMPLFGRKEGPNDISMATVLKSFLSSFKPLTLERPASISEEVSVSRRYANAIICNNTKSPSGLRVDRIYWHSRHKEAIIVHFVSCHDKLDDISEGSQSHDASHDNHMTSSSGHLKQKRRETKRRKTYTSRKEEMVEINASENGYYFTGVFTDLIQFALLCPLISSRVSFHLSLSSLEASLSHVFKDKSLLELALTHSSYYSHSNDSSSTPRDLRVSMSNCGLRSSVAMATGKAPPTKRPKSGLEGLTEASEVGSQKWNERDEDIQLPRDNERLEFLGDAVIEYLCSIQLYLMFSDFSDANLVIFRKALICNQNLATVAKRLELEKYLLIDKEVPTSSHVLANALEAVIGSIYIDSGIESCKTVLAGLLFPEQDLHQIWLRVFKDPLQTENPNGDRHMLLDYPILKSFTDLEEKVGVTFTNIRLLARSFTHPSYGYTNLLLGDYQRMEFLGDAILQLVTSVYVYDTFPLHHEGHLSTFRTAIVHNKQLAEVSDELGFPKYLLMGKDQKHVSLKIRADLIESFITALYLDKGMNHVETFCQICLFPKLSISAKGLKFLDPKTRLQHAVVYTCKREKIPIEFPVYRVLSKKGPVNSPIFTVGVYFRDKRIAKGTGGSSQKAGMDAAEKGLRSHHVRVPDCLRTGADT